MQTATSLVIICACMHVARQLSKFFRSDHSANCVSLHLFRKFAAISVGSAHPPPGCLRRLKAYVTPSGLHNRAAGQEEVRCVSLLRVGLS